MIHIFTKEFKVLVAFLTVCTLLVILIATTHDVQVAVQNQTPVVERVVVATPTPEVTVTPTPTKATQLFKTASPAAK